MILLIFCLKDPFCDNTVTKQNTGTNPNRCYLPGVARVYVGANCEYIKKYTENKIY